MALADVLSAVVPGSPEDALARRIDFGRLPRHIAVIMDGNGRWAATRLLPRVEGHRAGIDAVRDTVETSARLGISVLTLYAFSMENWKRPDSEIRALMRLLRHYLRLELNNLLKNNIRFNVIGQRDRLAPVIRDELEAAEAETMTNTGMLFNIALSYGGRAEIVDAARKALRAGLDPERARRADVRQPALHGGPARPGPADPHERRAPGQQLPALADRVRRDLGDRRALAGLPRARPPRGGRGLPEA